MSLIFATQLTAVATAVLAVFAIVTAVFAILAFRKQSQEVRDQASVLALQASELRESLKQREREAEQRHRGQASRVFITQDAAPTVPTGYAEQEGVGPFVTATVTNSSDQPIYNTGLRWHLGPGLHGEPNPDPIGTILPGRDATRMREFPHGADIDNSGADVIFTDSNNVRWIRRPDGYFKEFPV